jgi:ABC-2 type transport system ATP-binding protein
LVALDTKADLLGRGISKTLHIHTSQPARNLPPALADKVTRVSSDHIELSFSLQEDSVMQVLDIIRDAGIHVTDIRVEEDDLEDVFVQITRRGR